MPRHDEKSADCRVLTFKDGLLSKVAHDLDIAVTRFQLDIDPQRGSIQAEFDARSLRVRHAVRNGVPDPKALSDDDLEKIADQIRADVLEASRHPRITFRSRSVERRADGSYAIAGDLELHGVTRSLSVDTRVEGDRQIAEIELNQPDFGIVPYRAMMGTLKLRPQVRVILSIPESAEAGA